VRKRNSGILALSAVLVAVPAIETTALADRAKPPALRVCADPHNMPFSNNKGQGIDNAVAQIVAGALGMPVEYVWRPQRRGFVRNTLSAGRCDVMMEAPADYGRATTTAPYYRSSYVFLSRRDRHLAVRSFDDPRLRRLRIGVQMIGDDYANSPPAQALGSRGLAANIVGFPVYGDYSQPTPLSPIADAVVSRAVDVAVVWGPLGGWYAKQSPVRLTIKPVTPDVDSRSGLPLTFKISMAVRPGNSDLRRLLDGVIRTHRAAIEETLRGFGVPMLALPSQAPRRTT
jgi:mxaJ protein